MPIGAADIPTEVGGACLRTSDVMNGKAKGRMMGLIGLGGQVDHRSSRVQKVSWVSGQSACRSLTCCPAAGDYSRAVISDSFTSMGHLTFKA